MDQADLAGPPIVEVGRRDRGVAAVRRVGFVALAFAGLSLGVPALSAVPDTASMDQRFQRMAGPWTCAGHFAANNAPLAAVLQIAPDAASQALLVHHDDAPPGAYHSLEVWSTAAKGQTSRASIVDAYSGMRWFSSNGWSGSTLTWTRAGDGEGSEAFVYAWQPGGTLKIDWLTRRGEGALQLGDTLTCRKAS